MVLVVLLYSLFASTFTLGKAALSYVPPFLFISIRMILGGSILLGYYLLRMAYFSRARPEPVEGFPRALEDILQQVQDERKEPLLSDRPSDVGCIRWSAVIKKSDYSLFVRIILFHIFCAYTLEFWALEYITSAKACLLYNLSPFITALLCYFLRNERLTLKQVCGLIIGFLGFIPILVAQTPLETIGWHIGFLSCYEIALIFSVISSAYGWMTVKKLIDKKYSLLLINGIGMTGGGLLAFLLSLFTEGYPLMKQVPVTMPGIVAVVGYAGESLIMLGIYSISLVLIANIIGYNLYGYLLSRYSATFLSFAGFMTPLFAALLGWIFLDEKVTWHFFATMIFVVFGLYLFHEKKPIVFEEKGL